MGSEAGVTADRRAGGLAVAVALLGLCSPRWYVFAVAALTGMIEPVGGALGAGIMSVSRLRLPWGLACAASAMLYVICQEIIPATRRGGHQRRATAGLAVGLVLMLILDVWLG